MNSIVESFYTWYSNSVRNPKYRWLIVLGTFAYLFSPIDIAPDFIPIIGWLDDTIVLGLLTTELSRLAIDFRNERKNMKAQSTQPTEVTTNAVEVPIQ
ncbi:MAG: hypothetical protein N5P05_003895 [Chroococcopsis gigantea SAG 12.99]|jgi:uncharacterized membrane protein YkvA (DUF1232 family)|nr:DUF1232 domain-containing protein [Chlorogloea purpurea SAG 13.99]MDV3002289.1 hypothetical protein [Chroococcopsis gigantea SAG 12.99]